MSISRENINMNYFVNNFIYQSMLLRNSTTPQLPITTFQPFWLPRTTLRMNVKFGYQCKSFLVCLGLALAQCFKVLLGLFFNFYRIMHHRPRMYWSSSSTLANRFPGCFLALSTRARNSSRENSVGPACFSVTSLRRYLTARFSKFSSSAMMLMLRSISAFISIAVIIPIF